MTGRLTAVTSPLVALYRRVFRRLYTPDLRSQMLGYISIICLTRGIAYIQFMDLPAGLEIIATIIPIPLLAVLWLIMAGAGWIIAYRHLPGRGVIAVQTWLFRLWGCAYVGAWVLSGWKSGDWVGGSFYLCVAGFIVRIGKMDLGDD